MSDKLVKLFMALVWGSAFGYVLSMQFWAFFTAPWIREQGHRSSSWKIWFFGYPETFDLGKALHVAVKEHRHIPWPLWCHLILQCFQIVCTTSLFLLVTILIIKSGQLPALLGLKVHAE